MPTYDLLVFDLDGTLIDPVEGIGRSMDYSLVHHGYAPLPASRLSQVIGPPLDEGFAAVTGSTDPEEIASLVHRYRERYAAVGYSESILYPGIADAIETLGAQGVRMGVCTSKRADFAERILRLFGLYDRFDFLSGGDVGIQKWTQLEALRGNGTIGPDALMIGDRQVDLRAARRCGLSGAGVLWGFGSREELEAGEPRHLFQSPAEWLTLLGADRE